jgi:hypothetical protein
MLRLAYIACCKIIKIYQKILETGSGLKFKGYFLDELETLGCSISRHIELDGERMIRWMPGLQNGMIEQTERLEQHNFFVDRNF